MALKWCHVSAWSGVSVFGSIALNSSIGWYFAEFPDYEVDFMLKAEQIEIPYFGSWERKAMKGWRFAHDEVNILL